MARILLTGFGPFAGWRSNSSWEAVRLVTPRLGDAAAECLPVDHGAAAAELGAAIAREAPSILLLAGLAPDPVPRIETVGRPGPLAPWAGGVRCARWPVGPAQRAFRWAGLPVRISADAGRYVCDTTYWAALGSRVPRVVFLHLPPPGPAWQGERLARAVEACLSPVLREY